MPDRWDRRERIGDIDEDGTLDVEIDRSYKDEIIHNEHPDRILIIMNLKTKLAFGDPNGTEVNIKGLDPVEQLAYLIKLDLRTDNVTLSELCMAIFGKRGRDCERILWRQFIDLKNRMVRKRPSKNNPNPPYILKVSAKDYYDKYMNIFIKKPFKLTIDLKDIEYFESLVHKRINME